MIRRDRFGQSEIKQNRVRERERAGKQKRNIDAPAAQHATDRWTKNETQSKSRANQSHPLRAIFFRRHVRDVSLRGRDVATGNPIDDPAEKEHPKRRRESKNQKTETGSQQTDQQDRTPSILVR